MEHDLNVKLFGRKISNGEQDHVAVTGIKRLERPHGGSMGHYLSIHPLHVGTNTNTQTGVLGKLL